jgi:hypothetical protein
VSNTLVLLSGATGNLGGRIAQCLSSLKSPIRALVRPGTTEAKIHPLRTLGCEVVQVDPLNRRELGKACEGVSVVVSAVSGLRDVVVDAQSVLLAAAVEAKVPRFIPSDFAIDYTKVREGANRNLNLRLEFMKIAAKADIQLTSILNGAFTDMLTGTAPFVLFKFRRVVCWGNENQMMDWTTMDDTAKYTAYAALDNDAPRFLKIAGDQFSAKMLAEVMTSISGKRYRVLTLGTAGQLSFLARVLRALSPSSEKELYPAWQGMQYMANLYDGSAKFTKVDNARYDMKWTTAREVLAAHLQLAPGVASK